MSEPLSSKERLSDDGLHELVVFYESPPIRAYEAQTAKALRELQELREWCKQARMTFDRLAAFLQAKSVPYKVDWQDWIEEADRVLLARVTDETDGGR